MRNREIDATEGLDVPPNSFGQIGSPLRSGGQSRAENFANLQFHGIAVEGGTNPKLFLQFVVKLPDQYAGHDPMISLLSVWRSRRGPQCVIAYVT